MGHGRTRVIFVAHVCSFFKMGDSNVLAAFFLRGLKTLPTGFLADTCWALPRHLEVQSLGVIKDAMLWLVQVALLWRL